MQDLQISKRLALGEIDLRVGNGTPAAVLAVGTFILELPSGHVLELNDCYYVPSLTRNIIYVSMLTQCGYTFVFRNTGCYLYKNDVEICTVVANNGLYILNINISPTYNITNKRLKMSNKDETYMWHCRLGHINKTSISTLSNSGYLDGFDPNSYDICESYLLGKMPESPFSAKGEHATELLALVHSDVCLARLEVDMNIS